MTVRRCWPSAPRSSSMPAALVAARRPRAGVELRRPGFLARPWDALDARGRLGRAPCGRRRRAGDRAARSCWRSRSRRSTPARRRRSSCRRATPARASYERVAQVMGPGWPTPYNIVVVSKSSRSPTRRCCASSTASRRSLARDRRVASVVGPGALAATSKQLNALPAGLKDSTKLLKGGKKDLGTPGRAGSARPAPAPRQLRPACRRRRRRRPAAHRLRPGPVRRGPAARRPRPGPRPARRRSPAA